MTKLTVRDIRDVAVDLNGSTLRISILTAAGRDFKMDLPVTVDKLEIHVRTELNK